MRAKQTQMWILLLYAIAAQIGGWLMNSHAETFTELFTPTHFGGFMLAFSGALAMWMAEKPGEAKKIDRSKPSAPTP